MLNQDGFRLSSKNQKIYNSKAFYETIEHLIEHDLVRPFKMENDGCSYQLTDKGIFLGGVLTKNHNKKLTYILEIWFTKK